MDNRRTLLSYGDKRASLVEHGEGRRRNPDKGRLKEPFFPGISVGVAFFLNPCWMPIPGGSAGMSVRCMEHFVHGRIHRQCCTRQKQRS